jgi:hypothetical protein
LAKSKGQHHLESVFFVVGGNVEGFMNLLEGKVMRIQGCKIIGVTDSIHESNGPLGEIPRSTGTRDV